MKTIVILNDIENTQIETNYSASVIEQCFDNDGYCLLNDDENAREYMITPKSVMLIKTNFKS